MSNRGRGTKYSELFDLVGTLAQKRFRLAEHALSAVGLNHTEARLVSILRQEGGAMTQDELSAALTVDRSNAGRALKKLESHGFIARRQDEVDKRSKVVVITKKGREIAAEVEEIRTEIVEALFRDLAEPDAVTIVRILRRAFPDD
ncbi:MAG: MarR family transcriptional regulator [Pseudomonadota bacterium]